jgi:hypothetical protein
MGYLNLDFGPLRQRSMFDVFGGQQDYDPYGDLFQSDPIQPREYATNSIPRIADLMNQYYQPNNEASERFTRMVDEYPSYEEPSTLRKIGASLIGLGRKDTPAMQEAFLNRDYLRKVDDWKNQISPAMQAANLERYANANERQTAYQMATQELNERKLEQKTENDAANRDIRQQRADVYEWKAKHPGAKVVKVPGRNIYLVDPISGEFYDTGIDSGEMSESTRIETEHNNRMKEIGARGSEARKTRSTPSGGSSGGGRSVLPTQTKVDQYNRARELANTRPSLAKYIHLGDPGTNDFTVDSPKDNWFGGNGMSQEMYDEINRYIYGASYHPEVPKPKEGTKRRTTDINLGSGIQPRYQRNTVTGKVRVSYDGGKTWQEVK